MRVLVTGGAGFIGSHLTARLVADGHEVVVLDHRVEGKCLAPDVAANIRVVLGDATELATVLRAADGCEIIFHFAALVGVDHYTAEPLRTMQVEERALQAVCAAAAAVGCTKVIYASSSAVYGNAAGFVDEAIVVAPVSNYAVAKRYNESFLQAIYEETGLQSVACRIFNVYGPKQDERLVIPRFVRLGLAGETLCINGDGQQSRDFPYIGDVVEAVVRVAETVDGCERVNISTGIGHTIRSVAEMVIQSTGGRSRLQFQPVPESRRAFEVAACIGSTDKLQRLTGFRPSTTLETGLLRTVEHVLATQG